eukprot:scaffold390_cov44-Phaeocystis_antarctica.AAC.2
MAVTHPARQAGGLMCGQEGGEVWRVIVGRYIRVLGVVPIPCLIEHDWPRPRPAVGRLLHSRHTGGDIRPALRRIEGDANGAALERRHRTIEVGAPRTEGLVAKVPLLVRAVRLSL